MRKDFFISYTKKDAHWAEWIAWQLEEAGYTTTVQAWDFRPGTNFVLEMNHVLEGVDRIIAVISPEYLDDPFAQQEWQAAFARDENIIRVRVEPCEIDGFGVIYVDFVGVPPEEARDRLLSSVKRSRAKPRAAPIFPGTIKPRSRHSHPNIDEIVATKEEYGDYDIFMCHSSRDKSSVKEIALKLKDKGVLPWLDEWEIRPGTDWQAALERQITKIRSAGVFVSSSEFGPWQDLEKKAFLQQFLTRRSAVIPVILVEYEGEPALPPFLSMLHYVDFRASDPDPLGQLIWGITGKKPASL